MKEAAYVKTKRSLNLLRNLAAAQGVFYKKFKVLFYLFKKKKVEGAVCMFGYRAVVTAEEIVNIIILPTELC